MVCWSKGHSHKLKAAVPVLHLPSTDWGCPIAQLPSVLMQFLHPFPHRKTGKFSFLLFILGIWLGLPPPAGCLPDLSPHENRVHLCSHNADWRGLHQGAFGKGRVPESFGILRTSQHQSLPNVSSCPWEDMKSPENLHPPCCLLS